MHTAQKIAQIFLRFVFIGRFIFNKTVDITAILIIIRDEVNRHIIALMILDNRIFNVVDGKKGYYHQAWQTLLSVYYRDR
jgi:small basic protein